MKFNSISCSSSTLYLFNIFLKFRRFFCAMLFFSFKKAVSHFLEDGRFGFYFNVRLEIKRKREREIGERDEKVMLIY